MKTVKDLRQNSDSPLKESIDQHESYGMVNISHAQHCGKGIQLFGSSVKHNNYIILQINKAERHRDKYGDHYFAREHLIEIQLSPAQFVGMITQPNTSGIPCTLYRTENSGIISPAPEHKIKEEMEDDLAEKYKELKTKVFRMQKKVDELLKGQVKAADKSEIKTIITKIKNDVSSNLQYLQECQTKKLESVGAEIMAEAEASISALIKNTGLEELQRQSRLLGGKEQKLL